MKKLLMSCVFILSLCMLGGCSKDDEPGNGTSGYYEVDGNKVNLNYAYQIKVGGDVQYMFYDKDILKYAASSENPDVDLSCLAIYSKGTDDEDVSFIAIAYKSNPKKGTGSTYEANVEGKFDQYGSFSLSKGNVICSAKSLPMKGYTPIGDALGNFNATFSVEGKPKDMSSMVEDDYTRGIQVTEVTDPSQIELLRSFLPKH